MLQFSHRKIKVAPIMNDEELTTLLLAHYEGEVQTLTSGAEANFLKLKALMGILSKAWRINRLIKFRLEVLCPDEAQKPPIAGLRKAFCNEVWVQKISINCSIYLCAMPKQESQRWEDIKKTFRKNKSFRGMEEQNPVSQVVAQMSRFSDGLEDIRDVLDKGAKP